MGGFRCGGEAFMFAVLRYYFGAGEGLCHLILKFVSIVLQLCRCRAECLMWKSRLCCSGLVLAFHSTTPLREATTWRYRYFMWKRSQNGYPICWSLLGGYVLCFNGHLRSNGKSLSFKRRYISEHDFCKFPVFQLQLCIYPVKIYSRTSRAINQHLNLIGSPRWEVKHITINRHTNLQASKTILVQCILLACFCPA